MKKYGSTSLPKPSSDLPLRSGETHSGFPERNGETHSVLGGAAEISNVADRLGDGFRVLAIYSVLYTQCKKQLLSKVGSSRQNLPMKERGPRKLGPVFPRYGPRDVSATGGVDLRYSPRLTKALT